MYYSCAALETLQANLTFLEIASALFRCIFFLVNDGLILLSHVIAYKPPEM